MLKSLCQRCSHLGGRGKSNESSEAMHEPQHTFRTAFRLLATLQDSLFSCLRPESSLRPRAIFPAYVSTSFGKSANRASWRPIMSSSKG